MRSIKGGSIDNQFFADTYALVEIVLGNKNYLRFKNAILVTTKLNLMELYYYFLRNFSIELADQYFEIYSEWAVSITDSSIKEGAIFKFQNKKEKLSYVDCTGYFVALENNIKFLTGDEKFKNKPNVEFVK